MGTSNTRPRVYVQFKCGKNTMRRVLDLAFIDGAPVAVLVWANIDGRMAPADFVRLDAAQLRVSAPVGSWWYDGLVEVDPSKPRRS